MGFLTNENNRSKDIGLLIIRVVFGLVLFYGHGLGKLSVIFGGQPIQFMNPIGIGPELSFYLAAFAEGICSILLILGLFSRFASIILTLNFIIIVILHGFILGDGFKVLELRFLYLSGFLATILTGPGRYALDHVLFSRKR